MVEAEAAMLELAQSREEMEMGMVAAVMEKAAEAVDAPREAVTVAL